MPAGNDEFQEYLTKRQHDQPDRHRFGDALLLPDEPTGSFPGDTGDPGESEAPARADHRHGREAATAEDPTPVGFVSMFAGSTAPTGWLECNGSAVSRSTYSDLYNRVGTAFGVGDGTTTFNLPDYRDKFPLGRSGAAIIGATGGAAAFNNNHSGVTGVASATTVVQSGAGTTVASGTHTHSISTEVIPTLPPYQALMFVIKATA